MKITHGKFPTSAKKLEYGKLSTWNLPTPNSTENILHIFWVCKIPYKKISYNNLQAYFCNWWTISPWKLTDIIWNWNKVGLVSIAPASIVNSKSTFINLKNNPWGTSLKFLDIFKLSEIMFDIFRYFPNFQKFLPFQP